MLPESFERDFRRRIAAREAIGRLRKLQLYPETAADFASNDYLGLRNHTQVREAGVEAARAFGSGSGASRLVTGNYPLLETLENELAAWLRCDQTLVFPTGWQMNVSLIPLLASRNDAIIVDRLVHNSLMRGALASGAPVFRFKHNSVADAAACMEKARKQVTGNLVLVTESVFSMDGDCAPLEALSTLCESYQALFVVDEAHAFGVLGTEGRGLLASVPAANAHVILGTFGKSFGTSGAFAAVPELLKTVLINEAEGLIYSTGMAPFLAGATLEALHWVKVADEKRAHIAAQAGKIRKAFGIETTVQTPIIPVIIGSDSALETVKTSLLDAGIVTGFIRPPTVPENTARLRISVHAFNTAEDVSNLIQTVKNTIS